MSNVASSPEVDRLLSQALALSQSDRAVLADRLLASLDEADAGIDGPLLEELRRRWGAFESGKEAAIPAEVVFAELDRELGQP